MHSRHFLKTAWPWGAAILSGLLLTLCYPRFDQGWLCWIALTPLLSALWFSNETGRRVWLKKAGLGYVTGLIFFSLTFKWLSCLSTLFGSPWLALIPPLLALYLALYFGFWGWFVGVIIKERLFRQSRWNLGIAALCSAAWVGPEWVRGWLFGGFGWNGLGVALHSNLALIQIADLTGVWGLSFLVVFTNIIAVITVRRLLVEIKRVRLRPHYDFSLTMALIVVVFSYGVRSLLQKHEERPTLSVAAIQANIAQDEKSDEESFQKIRKSYTELSELALISHPQLLIWPESSVPDGGIDSNEVNHSFVQELASKPNLNFLLGSDDAEIHDGIQCDYNAAMLLTQQGKEIQVYHKIHLVPFGEYLPLRHSFPLFAWFAGEMVPGDFQPGTEYKVLETQTPPAKIGPLICFEDTLGDLTRQFVLKGAQVLVNITNDGWFQKTEGAEQHLANAVFRAIETRRPLIRAANTGITCIIDRCGRITQSLPPFTTSTLTGRVDLEQGETFYVKHGDYIPLASLILIGIACLSLYINLAKDI